jgi:hypothetical protein
MNIFDIHSQVVKDYSTYIHSFLKIADPQTLAVVKRDLEEGKLWPEPLLQFNPSYAKSDDIDNIIQEKCLHPGIKDIFVGYKLYRHQEEAIRLGTDGKDFIVTSGTGSGKSLTYITSIFNHLLKNPDSLGVVAIVVYPMNALINSQYAEFVRYKHNYENSTGHTFPITFGQYTGQEKEDARAKMRESPPHILLTNYMMLELLLTRIRERQIRDAIYGNMKFLIFDELHTYRGRQGVDVALLIQRIRTKCSAPVTCIGTSATMVSTGTISDQKAEVAEVAKKIFGKTFSADQVIGETLDRSMFFDGTLPKAKHLLESMQKGIDLSSNPDELKVHPLAIWLENKIALQERDNTLVRGTPKNMSQIVDELSRETGTEQSKCKEFLVQFLHWLSIANKQLQESGKQYSLIPFKIHQFISQTGSVYTTLDQDENRFITLEPGVFKKDESDKKPIFPNVFSRYSGHAFVCVTRIGNRLEPREFRESAEDLEEARDGYLIIGDDLWNPEEDSELLPESWLRATKSGLVPRAEKKPYFPVLLHFDEFGYCSENTPMRWWGWFMQAPLLFDPTAGVFYDAKTNEMTKLTKLGSEGRSTSTTINTFSILNRLADTGFEVEDQKLLSFTDNRQDAALQAGHFNDFVQVVRLRAGISQALKQSGALSYVDIGEAVFNALGLPFLDFANRNEEPSLAPVKRKYETCFKDYLFYRIIADLKRSWRIVLPNLEQCALLTIEYENLDEISSANDFWSGLPIISQLSQKERHEFIFNVLDFFRLEYAIHSENYLTHSRIKENEKRFREMLRSPWTLDRNEDIHEPYFIRLDPLDRYSGVYSKSMGPTSSLGKYIKLYVQKNDIDFEMNRDNYRKFIMQFMHKLEDADYLISKIARNNRNEEVSIYRLRLEKIIWKMGDLVTVKPDFIKQRSYKEYTSHANEFFQTLYLRDFSKMKPMRGDDHTGQLSSDTRIEREELFGTGKISALFCSPTMELGIDIKKPQCCPYAKCSS